MFKHILHGLKVAPKAAPSIEAIVSWTYYSSALLELPGNTLTWLDYEDEAFLCLNAGVITLSSSPIGEPLAWLNGGDIFALWAYDGKTPPGLQAPDVFTLPQDRTEDLAPYFKPINLDDLTEGFHYQGQNYPGPGLGSLTLASYVQYINDYPGWQLTTAANPNGQLVTSTDLPGLTPHQLSKGILDAFSSDMQAQELIIRSYWLANLDIDARALELWGFNREPWLTIFELAPTLAKEFLIRAVPIARNFAREVVWAYTSPAGIPFYSLSGANNWKFATALNPIVIPANYGLLIVDFFNNTQAELGPGLLGQTGQVPGVAIWYIRAADSYEPEIDLREFTPILPADFKEGYQYIVAPAQALPAGFVTTSTGPNFIKGHLARSVVPLEVEPADFYNRKLNQSAFDWAVKLAKLTRGQTYNLGSDVIESGPADLKDPLDLWHIAPLLVGFAAGDTLGHDDARVCLRLPLHYKRDSLQWRLAQAIAQAFLPTGLYEIGYHQFTADYSVAGEPIFDKPAPEFVPLGEYKPATLEEEFAMFQYKENEVYNPTLPTNYAFSEVFNGIEDLYYGPATIYTVLN